MTRAEGRKRQADRATGGVPQRACGQVDRRMPPVKGIPDDQETRSTARQGGRPNWLAKGGIDARARANTVWKELLAAQVDPPLDPSVDEALAAYVTRRKTEGGAPMN